MSAAVEFAVSQLTRSVDTPAFAQLEKITGIPRAYLVGGGGTVLFVVTFSSLGAHLLSDVLGFGGLMKKTAYIY